MTILITDQPGTNSNITSLIEAYKKAGYNIICGVHNFFYSNLVPDIVHIQWPEKIYSWYPFSALSEEKKIKLIEDRLRFYRNNKAVIVHTIHNVEPHIPEKIDFERKVFKLIIEYSDILSHYCSKSIGILNRNYPESFDKRNIANPRGDYLIDFQDIPQEEARRKLGIPLNKFVILNFGSQQRYKGEEFIEAVFKQLPVKEKYLLTAGNYRYQGYSNLSRTARMIRNYFRMNLKYESKKYFYKTVDPEDLPLYVNASDILFLGHHGGSLNSGILPLAATFAKPVVFPDIGCFKEQMNNWTFESYKQNDKQNAIQAIVALYNKIKKSGEASLDNSLWLEKNSWDKHVLRIINEAEEIKSKVNLEL